MAADGELDDILEQMRVWEQSRLTAYDPLFTAYKTVPTQAQLDAGLPYPHTIHVPAFGTYAPVSATQTPSLLEIETDTFYTYVVLAKDINDLDSVLTKGARWKRNYRRGWVKSSTLGGLVMPEVNQMKTWALGVWDVLGMSIVGLQIPFVVSTRVTLPTT